MKTIKYFTLVLLLSFIFISCNENDDPIDVDEKVLTEVAWQATETFSDLSAAEEGGRQQDGSSLPTSGDYGKFDFETGDITTSDTDWDIAFRTTKIIINGGTKIPDTDENSGEPERTDECGVYITKNIFDDINGVYEEDFQQDTSEAYAIQTGSGNGWYNYIDRVITPIAGRVIILKDRSGKFVKIQIFSYYQGYPGIPTSSDTARYYTFKYAKEEVDQEITE